MEFLSVTTGLSLVVLIALLFAPSKKKSADLKRGKQSNGYNGSWRSNKTKNASKEIE